MEKNRLIEVEMSFTDERLTKVKTAIPEVAVVPLLDYLVVCTEAARADKVMEQQKLLEGKSYEDYFNLRLASAGPVMEWSQY